MLRKTVSVIMALLMVFGITSLSFAGEKPADDFVPVIRFIASSDTHVKEDSMVNAERIGKMLQVCKVTMFRSDRLREPAISNK